MDLSFFVQKYNDYIEEKESDFIKKDKEIFSDYFIKIIKNEVIPSNSLVEGLVNNYIFDESSCLSSFLPLEEILQNFENEDWIAFAEYSGYDWVYVLNKATGKVFLVSEETNEMEVVCAKNEESFLIMMTEFLDLEILRLKNNEVEGDVLDKYYYKCLELSGLDNKEFLKYLIGHIPPAP